MDDTNPNPDAPARPIFKAVITPHRSLSARGFFAVMATVAAVSFVSGMVFLSIGAWPVFGFFGLDVALVWFAFRANYRSARVRETVWLSHDTLRIERMDVRGRRRRAEFNPYWARLEVERDDEFGMLSLTVVSRGIRERVGDWLSPPEREQFAGAFSKALHDARNTLPSR
ncbi:MAG: DUF2244 domain-containing protein [Rhodobiaceae bacterium]|nr:DUF2244 domain-containing protein [Rhodobiaceae bacterium]MCC0016028.1 DUF2244 domain-containing protein [Rhodobiaceae bacterium]